MLLSSHNVSKKENKMIFHAIVPFHEDGTISFKVM